MSILKVDLMVTDTNFSYQPALFDLANRLNEVLRPLIRKNNNSGNFLKVLVKTGFHVSNPSKMLFFVLPIALIYD